LLKKGEVNKAFQRRWFVLKGNLLFYFEKKTDKEPIGVIILEGCTIELSECEEQYALKLVFHGGGGGMRTYELVADSQASLESWMKALARASYDYLKLMLNELQKQLQELEDADGNANSIEPPKAPPRRHNPFNKNQGPEVTLDPTTAYRSRSNTVSSVTSNSSIPNSQPQRTAPPPPPLSSVTHIILPKKTFIQLHTEYGERILADRASYTCAQEGCAVADLVAVN